MSVVPITELDFGRIKVCGRDAELKQLRQALARCCCRVTTNDHEDKNGVSSSPASSSSCEVILIEGASGTGKSCLVDAFQEESIALFQKNAQQTKIQQQQPQKAVFFCRGKYDENAANSAAAEEPFQAITECIDSLLHQMLQLATDNATSSSEATSVSSATSSSIGTDWKALLSRGLSRTELKLLSNISPAFDDILLDTTAGGGGGAGEEDSVSTMMSNNNNIDVRSSWSFDRLRLAIRSFFRVVCQHAATTVILVQDDLQWMDAASLKIVQTIVSDKQAKNLLFVGTHRGELEREDEHIIHSQLKSSDRTVTVLKLGNLHQPAVTTVISSLTRREECDCEALANVLLQRTGGNAFFLVQFLRVLHEKGLLYYSLSTYQWEWDMDRVMAETEIADNVLDIVSSKIQQLDGPLQMALKGAACLGSSRFDIYILAQTMLAQSPGMLWSPGCSEQPCLGQSKDDAAMVDDDDMERLAGILDKLIVEGLLEKLGAPGKYKFTHDRIRESIWALLPQGDVRVCLHLDIGRRLRHLSTCVVNNNDDDGETRGKDRLVLISAYHLNLGSKGIFEAKERSDLIALNMKAAEVAFERSCFIPAANYLKAALELIDDGEERWNVHYETSLKICTTLAHILFCCGNLGESEAMAQDIIHHARHLDDQLGAFRSLINCQAHSGRSPKAIQTIVTVLNRLGFHVPNRMLLMPMVAMKFARMKRRLRKMSDSDLLNLPEANKHDVKVMDFVGLLGDVSMAAGDSDMEAASAIYGALLNLECGASPYTATALAVIGFMFGHTGDYEAASRYGKLAMQIVTDKEEYNMYSAKAILICNFFIRHLKRPLPECLDPVLKAKQIIFEAGAVEYMYMPIVVYSSIYYHCGLRLEPLDRELSKLTEALVDYGQSRHALSLVECQVQYIQNLMGKSDDPLVLTGETMNQDKSLTFYTEAKQVRALQSFYIYRMCLGYYFGDLDLAKEMSSKLFAPMKEGPTPVLAPRFLFQGLIAFALAQSTRQHIFYAHQGRSFLKRLKKMVRKGCINVHHIMLLLQAEEMTLHGKLDTVQEAYDEAIRAAGKLGLIHNQALGNERAGVFFLRKGDTTWASTYLSRAWLLYVEWGASAKANHLKTKYGPLIIDKNKMASNSGTGIKARSRFGGISAVDQSIFPVTASM